MRGQKALTIQDFSAGLVETEGGVDLPAGAGQAMQNVLPIGRRGVKRREPTSLLYTHAQNIGQTWVSNVLATSFAFGSSNVYIATTGVSLGAHGMLIPIEFTVVDAPESGGQGPVYISGGGGTPKYIDSGPTLGNWTASAGTVPRSSVGAMAWHGNRMWIAGDTATSNYRRLFFSEINDPRVWSGGTSGYVDFPATINAVCPCGPYLLVFTDERVYSVYDLDTGANRAISKVRTLHQSSVAEGRYGTAYFLAYGDRPTLYRTDGSSVAAVSGVLAQTDLGSQSAGVGRIAYANGHVMVAAPDGLTLLVLVEDSGSWWRLRLGGALAGRPMPFETQIVSTGQAVFSLSDGNKRICTLALDTISESPTAGNDGDGSTITSYWWGSDLDMGVPEFRKRLRHVDIEGTGLASAGVAADCSTSAPTVQALSFGPSGSTVKSARLNSLGVARYWAPYLYDATANAWSVRAITMNFDARRN